MAKLTRYNSYDNLKASSNLIPINESNQLKKISELEDFINLLRKKSLAKKNQGQKLNGQ